MKNKYLNLWDGKKKAALNRFLLIGILLISLVSLAFIVSALTTEEQAVLQVELDNLTSQLTSNGYGWLVNYSIDYNSISDSSQVQVFREGDNNVLAVFNNISSFGKYRILLTNLSENESYSTFDLKSLGDVDYDYVVDPYNDTGALTQNVNDCGELNTTNGVYTLTGNVSSTSTCFNIKANNITLDCGGFMINYSTGASGLAYGVNSTNVNFTTIKNCLIYEGTYHRTPDNKHNIYFTYSNNGTIFNNTLIVNDYSGSGVYSTFSSSSLIDSNIINFGRYNSGVSLGGVNSNVNTVQNNILNGTSTTATGIYYQGNLGNILNNSIFTLESTSFNGIKVKGSTANFTNNTLIETSFFLDYNNYGGNVLLGNSANNSRANSYTAIGATLADYNNSIDTSNLAEGLPVVYNFSISNQVLYSNVDLSNVYGQLICAYCSNVTYDNITIGGDGINLFATNYSTISNSNINTSKGYGIFLYSGYSGFRPSMKNNITNNNITTSGTNGHGIYLNAAGNNTLSGNNVSTIGASGHGIYLLTGANYNTISQNNVRVIGSSAVALKADTSDYLTIERNELYSALSSGINCYGGGLDYSLLVNNNITAVNGMYIDDTQHSIFINNSILSSGDAIWTRYTTDNDTFIGMKITTTGGNGANAFYGGSDAAGSSISFVDSILNASHSTTPDIGFSTSFVINLTNTTRSDGSTIPLSKISFNSDSRIIMNWYLDTFVNDSAGLNVSGANVTGWQTNGTQMFNGTTDASGMSSRFIVTEFVQNSTTKTFFTNYTVNASAATYLEETKQLNLTGNNIGKSFFFTLSKADSVYPVFSSPWDNNGTLVGSGVGLFNVTVENTNGTVWLEINNTDVLASNISNVYSANYSFVLNGTYNYRWWAYGNGTENNVNMSELSNYFVLPDPYPNISFSNPTAANNSYLNSNSIYANISSSDDNTHYAFADFDRSLVGWWTMDDVNSSGSPIDFSSWSNNGTKVGNATQVTNGKFGKGFEFDGAGDYVNVGDKSSVEVGTNSLTISVWVNSKSTSAQGVVTKRGGGYGNGYELFVTPNGYQNTGYCGLLNSSATINAVIGGTAQYLITPNNWSHVVCVIDRANNISVYVNGILAGNRTIAGTSWATQDLSGSSPMVIGAFNTAWNFFNGTLDDLIMFNRTLSSSEIVALYNATASQYSNNFTSIADGVHTVTGYAVDSAGNRNNTEQRIIGIDTSNPVVAFVIPTPLDNSSQSGNSIYVNLSSNDVNHHYAFADFDRSLVGWWTMDDVNSSGSPTDISGSGNNGSKVGGAAQVTNGKFGKGFSFDGSSDLIQMHTTSSLNTTAGSSWTISTWVNTNDVSGYPYIVSNKWIAGDGAGSQGGLALRQFTSGVAFYITNSSGGSPNSLIIGSGVLGVGSWAHVVAVYNGSSKNASLYKNGVVQSSNVGTSDLSDTNNVYGWGIGGYTYPSAGSFNGMLDDVLIFNRSLSSSEIAALYNASANKYYNNFTGLSSGNHSFTGYSVDIAGNRNANDTRTVTITSETDVSACKNLTEENSVYTLQDNIVAPGQSCLIVQANNITIDFNSHSMTGDSAGTDLEYGVNISGYNNTKILNGKIIGFTWGVYSVDNYFTNISGGNYSNNGPDDDTVNNNNGYNIYLYNSHNYTIENLITERPTESRAGSCFIAGTKVSMADGTLKNIEDVSVGDYVLSYNIETEQNVPQEVLEIESPIREGYYSLNNGLIGVTSEHPFYVKKSDGTETWASLNPERTLEESKRVYNNSLLVDNLEIGDEFFTSSGEWVVLSEIKYVPGDIQTYNLKAVANENNFYANNLLVHNKRCAYLFSITDEGEYFEDVTLGAYKDEGNSSSEMLNALIFKENEGYSYLNLEKETNKLRLVIPPHEIDYIDYVYLKVIDTNGEDSVVYNLSLVSSSDGFDLLKEDDSNYFILDGETNYPSSVNLTFEEIPAKKNGYERKVQFVEKGYSEDFGGSMMWYDFAPFNQTKWREWLDENDNFLKLRVIIDNLVYNHFALNESHSELYEEKMGYLDSMKMHLLNYSVVNETRTTIQQKDYNYPLNTEHHTAYGIYVNSSNYGTIRNIVGVGGEAANGANVEAQGIFLGSNNNTQINNVSLSDWMSGITFSLTTYSQILNSVTNSNPQASGIWLSSSSYNQIVNVTSVLNGGNGIWLSSSSNNNISQTNCSLNSNPGLDVYLSSNNTFTNIIANENGGGIRSLFACNNNNFINITANSNTYHGISISGSNNNILNANLWNCSFGEGDNACIYISASDLYSDSNVFENIHLNSSFKKGIMIQSSSSGNTRNNLFKNIKMENIAGDNIYIYRTAGAATNNTFLNVTYDESKVSFSGTNIELIRKWYYQANVTNSSGSNLNGANVTAYNVTGAYNFNLTTNSSGLTGLAIMTDYVQTANTTRTYYSPYNIYASNASYVTQNHSFNASLGNNLNDVFTLSLAEVATQLTTCDNLTLADTTYTLQNDVSSTGTCFNINATNVTLDCNGKTVTGNNSVDKRAIDISGYNNITVKNCRITAFTSGIYGNNVTGLNITNNTIYDGGETCASAWGIYFSSVNNSYIQNNNITNMYGDYNNMNCDLIEGGSIYLLGSYNNLIEENNLNGKFISWTSGSDYGVYIFGGSNNTIRNITAYANYDGIYLLQSSNNTLTNLNASLNTAGNGIYLLQSSNNLITNLTSNSNVYSGIYLALSSNNTLTNINAKSNTDGHGIYLLQSSNNTLTNITANLNSQNGIYLLQSSNNTVININASSNLRGLYFSSSLNNTLTNITSNSNSNHGVLLLNSSNNALTNLTSNSNLYYGLYLLTNSNNNVFESITTKSNKLKSILIDSSSSNQVYNLSSWNCSGAVNSCVEVYSSGANADSNVFDSVYLNYSIGRGIIIHSDTSGNARNNLFKNIKMENIAGDNVYINRIAGAATNNTFLNATFNASKVSISGTSIELIRKWYYQAYVNDTSGNNVSNANVSVFNVTGAFNFNLTTGITGLTTLGEITDYVQTANTTKSYYSNYTIYASNASYVTGSHGFNASLGNNLNDVFTLSLADLTAPAITIISPLNNSNLNLSSVNFNISTNENVSWCGLSISGAVNTSMMLDADFRGALDVNSSIADGTYNFIISCNDTSGNLGNTGINNFLIDTIYPAINFTSPTPSDGSSQFGDSIYVNISSNDTNQHYVVNNFDNSLVGWWRGENGAEDESGYGNDGTFNGNAQTVSNGKFGKGFEFDGNTGYIQTAEPIALAGKSYTLSAWAKRWPNGLYQKIINQGTNYAEDPLEKTLQIGYRDSDYLYCAQGSDDLDSLNTYTDTDWHLISCTYDLSSNTRILYVDGVELTRDNPAGIYAGTGNIYLGQGEGLSMGYDSDYFNGSIDDVLIFNRSLSDVEIAALYNASASQYYNNFTNVSAGVHTITGYAVDFSGNRNNTETREITVSSGIPPTQLTTCDNLTSANTTYVLMNNVSSSATCMNILANNITLDCAGFMINYSTGGVWGSNGVNISGFNFTTVQNCNIRVGVAGSCSGVGSYGIEINQASYSNLINVTIPTTYGVRIRGSSSRYNNLLNNTLSGSGGSGCPVIWVSAGGGAHTISGNTVSASYGYTLNMDSAGGANNTIFNNTFNNGGGSGGSLITIASINNNFTNNIISSNMNGGYGLSLTGSNNTIVGNQIKNFSATGGTGFYVGSATNNTFTNNTVTSPVGQSYVVYGTTSTHYNQSIDTSNLAEGLPVYYNYSLQNQAVLNNVDVSGTYGQVICGWCQNVTYNNVTMGRDGINLFNTNYSTISNSNINTSKGYGVWLYKEANWNNVTGNDIDTYGSYGYGVYLAWSTDNNLNNNNITTYWTNGYGVLNGDGNCAAVRNNLTSNRIITHGSSAIGVYHTPPCGTNAINIMNNTILVDSGNGINAGSILVSGNTVNCYGANARAIYTSGIIESNIVFANGSGGAGIVSNGPATITRNIINTTGQNGYGIMLGSNQVINNNIVTTSGSSANGINVQSFGNNYNNISFSNLSVKTTGSSAGALYLDYGTNVIFTMTDSILNSSLYYDFYPYVRGYSSLGSATIWNFTNVTKANGNPINLTWAAAANGTLYMNWYLDTFVNDTAGLNVSSATVTGYDVLGNQDFTGTTDASGMSSRFIVTEFVQNSTTKTYFTNYTVNASADTYTTGTKQLNLTGNNIGKSFFITLSASDLTAPVITLTAPLNNSNLNLPSVDFNISTNENLSWCGLSISGGANETMTLSSSLMGANYTNSSIADGAYTFIISCNDTSGNLGNTGINNFLIDTIYPAINFTDPTPSNGTTQSSNSIYVNLSSSDAGQHYVVNNFDNSLVGWWTMDDVNSSGSPTDISGRGNNGSKVGGAAQVSNGKFGKGFEFDGSSGYVRLARNPNVTNAITFSSWIYMNGDGLGGYHGVANALTGYLDNDNRILIRNSDNKVDIQFWAWNTNDFYSTGGLTRNAWHHIVFTAFNNTANTSLALYIDGILNNSANYSLAFPTGNFATRIGRGHNSNTFNFNGSIDDVLIFNRSLSAVEIAALYNSSASQYYNNFTGLAAGVHTITGYAVDLGGNRNNTETREITYIANSAPYDPVVSLLSVDGTNSTGSNLNCSATLSDPDAGNLLNVSLVWYKNNVTNLSVDYNNSYSNGTMFSSILASGNLSVGDSWKCGLRLNDGIAYSNWVNSSALTVASAGLTTCSNLTLADTTYYLMNNVSTTGNCFTVSANNITLDCGGKTITGNNAYGGKAVGISAYHNVTVKNCRMTTITYGVYGANSLGLNITNNTMYDSGECDASAWGIYFSSVNNSYIKNNNITNMFGAAFDDKCWFYGDAGGGIYLTKSNDNLLSDNNLNGKYVTGISGADYGISLEVGSNNNTITNITSYSNSVGILLGTSSNNIVTNITSYSNSKGVSIVSGANSNQIFNINSHSNTQYGISIAYTFLNILRNNTMSNNTYNFEITGLNDPQFNQSIDTSNIVDGSYKLYYNYSISDYEFNPTTAPDAGVVLCAKCNNITVRDLNLSHRNREGVYLFNTTNSRIENIVSGLNYYGVSISYGFNNLFSNITSNSNSKYGITISYGYDNQLSNLISNLNQYGINIASSYNNTLSNITSNSNSGYGINIASSYKNNLSNITSNSNTAHGINMAASYNNTLSNIFLNSNSQHGIYISASTSNIVSNMTTWNCSSSTSYSCISVITSSLNIYDNIDLNLSLGKGIWISSTSTANAKDNIFKNIKMENIAGDNVYISRTAGAATNNTFLNATFNASRVSISGTSIELIRKWHYGAYVNDTNGNNVSNANVSAFNVTGAFNFNLTTGITGLTTLGEITDYVQTANTTKNYYSNYTIYASNASYSTGSHAFNASLGNNLRDVFTLSFSNSVPYDPIVFINSSDGTNTSQRDLNCFATLSDPDAGNKLNVSVQWFKNDALNLSVDYNNSYSNGTLFNAVLDYGNLTKHQNWSCGIRVNDGSLYSNYSNSSSLTILNSVPWIRNDTLLPLNNNITTNRTPLFSWEGFDADSDVLTYELNLTKTGSSLCIDPNLGQSGLTGSSYAPTSQLKCFSDNNDYYLWQMRANDGEVYSAWTEIRNLSIQSYLDIFLNVSAIDFGIKNVSDIPIFEADTSEDSPAPFIVENRGNAISNVSLQSTSLWVSNTTESDYYKFKVGNVTGFEGAFNWLSSIVSWMQMPITGGVTGIAQLNNSQTKNKARVDVYIKVPPNEPPGFKNSTVIFTPTLAE